MQRSKLLGKAFQVYASMFSNAIYKNEFVDLIDDRSLKQTSSKV